MQCSPSPKHTLDLCHREQTESLIDWLIHPGEAAKEAGSMVLSSKQKYSRGGCEESKESAEKCRESCWAANILQRFQKVRENSAVQL